MSTLDNPKIRTYLVAGNGFDIALGLKTKYSDFFMVIGLISMSKLATITVLPL